MQDFRNHKNEDIKDQKLKTSGLIKMKMTSGSLKIESMKDHESGPIRKKYSGHKKLKTSGTVKQISGIVKGEGKWCTSEA
jgi:hypothetical protein